TQRVRTWLDAQHAGDKPRQESEHAFSLAVGCRDPKGFVPVGVAQDRGKGADATRWNYILRVSATAIEELDSRTSTASDHWEEWADEGGLELVAQVDLDGDGALDIVIGHYEHEGGSSMSYTGLVAQLASGKTVDIARAGSLVDVQLVQGQLVVGA